MKREQIALTEGLRLSLFGEMNRLQRNANFRGSEIYYLNMAIYNAECMLDGTPSDHRFEVYDKCLYDKIVEQILTAKTYAIMTHEDIIPCLNEAAELLRVSFAK